MEFIILIGIIIWIICGILACGFDFAYWCRTEFNIHRWIMPHQAYGISKFEPLVYIVTISVLSGIFGPIGLFLCLIDGRCKYGFSWKWYKEKK